MFEQIQTSATTIANLVNPTRFNSRHCMIVARHLVSKAPADLTEWQQAALDRVVARAQAVDEVRKGRQRRGTRALREPRNAMVAAWRALYDGLAAVAAVPRERSPLAGEAATLRDSLFPEGLDLTTVDTNGVWTYSRLLFERIEEEALQPRIESVVTPVLLASARGAFVDLGATVGADHGPLDPPAPRALVEATSSFSYAVASYARALSVTVDEGDAAQLTAFRNALGTIDAHRVSRRATPSTDEELEAEELEDEALSEEAEASSVAAEATEAAEAAPESAAGATA